uniref:G-protein coupled receptors family 2 profile 2 domain-containing protein n=1 Tax=Mastacembelus armatus TaxID=205130 RepID=A0A7N8YP48_9TELE
CLLHVLCRFMNLITLAVSSVTLCPNIPNYLLVLALLPFMCHCCASNAAQPQVPASCFRACLLLLLSWFAFIWLLAGDVWVFSVYQPNYDPTAADGLYCNKTLYTFALWNAVWETLGLGYTLARFCKGLLFSVVLHPAPVHRDVYGHV